MKILVDLVSYTQNPLQTIEKSAAICYDSTPSETGRITKACYRSNHLSVLEHASFTFHVKEVSRVLLAQISRHRHISLSVRSQRYCDEFFPAMYVPPMVGWECDSTKIFTDAVTASSNAYMDLVCNGVEKEDARMVLPSATCTEFNITLNLRSLILIANERLCSRAQLEIRQLVTEMCRLVSDIEPVFKEFLVPKCERNAKHPFCTEAKSCGRHPKLEDIYGQK